VRGMVIEWTHLMGNKSSRKVWSEPVTVRVWGRIIMLHRGTQCQTWSLCKFYIRLRIVGGFVQLWAIH
jgi:hypothetical protein